MIYAYFIFLVQNGCSVGLELDLEHYVVPTPATSANSAHVYAANLTENPRSLIIGSGSSSYPIKVFLSKLHFKIMITAYCCEYN